jgi:hypothetical protein
VPERRQPYIIAHAIRNFKSDYQIKEAPEHGGKHEHTRAGRSSITATCRDPYRGGAAPSTYGTLMIEQFKGSLTLYVVWGALDVYAKY